MKCPVTKKNCSNPKCKSGCVMKKKKANGAKKGKPIRKVKKKGY